MKNEFAALANSGTVIIYPIAYIIYINITVDNSYPLNHLPIMAAYAITKFSEAQPKITLPTNIIQNILKAPPNATIVYATTIIALKNRIPNLTP